MTITTIARTSATPIPTEADFNAVLDTTPCEELAKLQENLNTLDDSMPNGDDGLRPPPGLMNQRRALLAEIKAKRAECDAYNGTPAPTPTPTPTPARAETKPQTPVTLKKEPRILKDID